MGDALKERVQSRSRRPSCTERPCFSGQAQQDGVELTREVLLAVLEPRPAYDPGMRTLKRAESSITAIMLALDALKTKIAQDRECFNEFQGTAHEVGVVIEEVSNAIESLKRGESLGDSSVEADVRLNGQALEQQCLLEELLDSQGQETDQTHESRVRGGALRLVLKSGLPCDERCLPCDEQGPTAEQGRHDLRVSISIRRVQKPLSKCRSVCK